MGLAVNISLDNLTARQVEIADELWMCDTDEDVEQYVTTLTPEEQRAARALIVCMIQEAAAANLNEAAAEAMSAIAKAQQ